MYLIIHDKIRIALKNSSLDS